MSQTRVTWGVWGPTLSRRFRLCTVTSKPWAWLYAVRVLASETLLRSWHSGNKACPVPYVCSNSSQSYFAILSPSSASIPSISVLQPRFSLCIFILVHYPPLSLPILDQIFLRLGQDRNTGEPQSPRSAGSSPRGYLWRRSG